MEPVLIGSRALAFWVKDFPLKADADWDVISDSPIEGTEWHDPEFLNNRAMAEEFHSFNRVKLPDGGEAYVMSLCGLALIKRSHLWRDLSFQKHITHYHKYLKYHLFSWQDDRPFLEERIRLTKEAFPQGNPNLNQMNADFFKDAVTKKYDHDWLHELYAFYERPLYTRMQVNPDRAWCDVEKWNQFSFIDKVRAVAEEAYVIATERFMVPNNWEYNPKRAYIKSVDKICTTLCSGWFRDFAIDYYPHVVELFDEQKIKDVVNLVISLPESERRYFKS